MGVVVVRPTSTVANGGWIAQPSGTRHGVTSDDSDSTWLEANTNGSETVLGCGSPSIPSGAVTTGLALYVRGGGVATIRFRVWRNASASVPSYSQEKIINQTSLATWTPSGGFAVTLPIGSPRIGINRLSGGIIAFHELYLWVFYVAKPVVTVSAPTGTIANTNKPVVRWDLNKDDDGGACSLRLNVFSEAQYSAGGFNPATSTPVWTKNLQQGTNGERTWQIEAALPNATYRAYMRAAQSVNGQFHYSDWDFSQFTIDLPSTPPSPPPPPPPSGEIDPDEEPDPDADPLPAPDEPTITVTPQAEQGRIRVNLTANGDPSENPTHYFVVHRSDDGGTTWEAVRGSNIGGVVRALGEVGTIYDYEAPNEVDVIYRARAAQLASFGGSSSQWVEADSVSYDTGWWLVSPVDTSLSLNLNNLRIRSLPGHDRSARVGVHQPLGSTRAVAIADTPGPESGELQIRCDTNEERAAVDALIDSASPVLLRGRASEYHRDRWVILTDMGRERIIDHSWAAPTWERFSWTEVARPTSPLQASISPGDLIPGLGPTLYLPFIVDAQDNSGNDHHATLHG